MLGTGEKNTAHSKVSDAIRIIHKLFPQELKFKAKKVLSLFEHGPHKACKLEIFAHFLANFPWGPL